MSRGSLRWLRRSPVVAAVAVGLAFAPAAGAQAPVIPTVPAVPTGSIAVVTRDDGTVFSAISETQFDRFFDAALSQAQQKPISKITPLVPPRFTACVAATSGGTRHDRWAACASEYAAIKNTAVQQVLNLNWIMAEAERRAIVFTDQRLAREIRTVADEQFKGPRGLRRFLRSSGLSEADIRLNVLAKLAQDAIVRQLQAPSGDDVSVDAQTEQQQAINDFRAAFLKRSAAATTCAPYYAKLPACTGETDA